MSEVRDALQRGKGMRASVDAIKALAEAEGWDFAFLGAVVKAESGSEGFDGDGRVKVLFEKHHFYRHVPAEKRAAAVKAGLARKKFIRPQDGGYKDQPNNAAALSLLLQAIEIDETAALLSASYGLGQVLGSNFKVCGWPSVQAFVVDMTKSEDEHIKAMAGFIRGKGLSDEMRAKDARGVARGYNGAGNVEAYAAKISAHYKRLTGSTPAIESKVRAGGLRVGSTGYRVEALQRQLSDLGYVVKIDGDFGPGTKRAVLAFQAENKLETDGVVGPATQAALDGAKPVIEPARAEATATELREQGSRIVTTADKTEGVGIIATLLAVFTGLAQSGIFGDFRFTPENIGALRELIVPLAELVRFAAGNVWLMVALAGVAVVILARRIRAYRVEDHRRGLTV